ncbi:hypothetical protein SAMN06272735_5148 [Streptomyces sp. TLI_55]|uniref:hypothetical protein n=1 Tax=Streptomyces sp. TLI_55 TaxID=1938861 RepID=UPI000BCD40DC|nr:hypothetical protein SAMN06272735_5148 [Streptomyces sp. TLI_55]
MMLTVDVAVLLAVILVLRLRRTVHARSRSDQGVTVGLALVFGVLVAPTAFGHEVLNVVAQVVEGVSGVQGP